MNRIKIFAKWSIRGLLVALLLIQLRQPDRAVPPLQPDRELMNTPAAPDARVAKLLRAACYDCHSYETRWPWFDRPAPVSWWVADHIAEGREHLNFSEWPVADPARARKKLRAIADTVSEGEMPLKSYTWIHPAARLTAADKQLITDWAEAAAAKLKPAEAAGE